MEQSNQSKKVLLSVIGVAILVVAVVGVSFAFFNYTRTSTNNQSIQTGQISFSSTQNGDISITNFFPTVPGQADASNSSSVTIDIQGSTNYSAGMDYRIKVVDVAHASNAVPISVVITDDIPAGTGTEADPDSLVDGTATFTPVGAAGTTGATLSEGLVLANGHIPADQAVSGTVTVTAMIPANVAITDTPVESTTWLEGRDYVSTSDWNALGTNPVTFKIRVEAKQTGGAYVGDPARIS